MNRLLPLALPLAPFMLTGACHDHHDLGTAPLGGDSPQEVAQALTAMERDLPPARQKIFAHAVRTLELGVPDKADPRSDGGVTPQLAGMVQGRSPDQIIQLADLYRLSVPADRPAAHGDAHEPAPDRHEQ